MAEITHGNINGYACSECGSMFLSIEPKDLCSACTRHKDFIALSVKAENEIFKTTVRHHV